MNSKNKGKSRKSTASKSAGAKKMPANKFQKFGSMVKKVDTSTMAALTVFLSSSNSWAATCY